MSDSQSPIHAVIGVRYCGASTFYVKRSLMMRNYPGVWSLFSIQFKGGELPDVCDLKVVGEHFRRMSEERLGGVPVATKRYLTSGSSDQNPMGVDVNLYLYEIEFAAEPILNPAYYTDGAWLLPEEYEARCADKVCGLCLRLWADYAWMVGYTDRPFRSTPPT